MMKKQTLLVLALAGGVHGFAGPQRRALKSALKSKPRDDDKKTIAPLPSTTTPGFFGLKKQPEKEDGKSNNIITIEEGKSNNHLRLRVARRLFAAALALTLLACWPQSALAKGGGRGGGGGSSYSGGSSRSYSSPSRSYSSPSYMYRSSPTVIMPVVPRPYYGGGFYSPPVVVAPSYSPYYSQGPVNFVAVVQCMVFGAIMLGVWSVLSSPWPSSPESKNRSTWFEALDDYNRLIRDLKRPNNFLSGSTSPPFSGAYEGATHEDDYADQDVATYLSFEADGTLTGAGKDDLDGAYKIESGHWSRKGVAWTEKYDDGLKVLVTGRRDDDGSIDIEFTSSRCVSGTATLKPCYPGSNRKQ